jgi:hypothetical protein
MSREYANGALVNATESTANSSEVLWSQWVDATLAQWLLVRVKEADFVRGRQFKQNKSPV